MKETLSNSSFKKFGGANPKSSKIKTYDYSPVYFGFYDVSKNIYGHFYLWICDELKNSNSSLSFICEMSKKGKLLLFSSSYVKSMGGSIFFNWSVIFC